MTSTLTLPPSADLSGSWELVNPVPFSGSGYTEPRVIGSVAEGYLGGNGGAVAANTGLPLPAISTPPSEIEFIGSTHVFESTQSTSLDVDYPSVTIEAGDLVEWMVFTQEFAVNDPGIPATPAGLTKQWEIYTTQQFRPHTTKFYKIAAGGESGSVTFTWPTDTNNHTGVCQVWRGVDQEQPYDEVNYSGGVPPWLFGYNISPPDPPEVFTTVDGSMVCTIACGNDVGGSVATISAGFAETVDGSGIGASLERAFANGHKTANVGSVNPGAYSWTRDNWVAATEVLRPAGGNVTAIIATSVLDDAVTAQVGTAPTLLAQNEEQTLTAEAGLGSFTLTFDGQTTASLSATASSSDIQTALEALSNLSATDVSVADGPLGTAPVRVEFNGTYEATNVALMTSSDSDLSIAVTRSAAAAQTFTFEASVNIPGSAGEPQIHVWSLAIASGYYTGRRCSFVVADHDDLDSWAAVLLILENVDQSTFPSAASADTEGTSAVATFAAVSPPSHGSKVLALIGKGKESGNYSTYPASAPSPAAPSGYSGITAGGDKTTLSAFVSAPLAADAETPSTSRWSGTEQWVTAALGLEPILASSSAASLFSVIADDSLTSWLELGPALGQMYEAIEFDLSELPADAFISSASIRFTHSSDAKNPISVMLAGVDEQSTELVYPNPSGTVLVGASDDLQAAVSASSPGDLISISAGDFTDDSSVLSVPHRVYLRGMGVGQTKLPRIELVGDLNEIWLSDFTVERTTPVTTNFFVGIRNTSGALTDFLMRDIEITGHGISDGIEINRRYDNDRGVIHSVEVHEIENKAFVLYCDNLRTWGLIGHDQYRTVDQGFSDVDVINLGGSNQLHSGFYFYGIHEDDSLHKGETNGPATIPASSGRANPAGPVGTANTPHTDAGQSFKQFKLDGVTPWITRNVEFRDGVVDFRPASGVGGSGGRHLGGFSNFDTGGNYWVGDIRFTRVKVAFVGTQALYSIGADGIVVDDCDFWALKTNTDPVRATYQAISYQGGGGTGPATCPGAQILDSRFYRQSTAQQLYNGTPSVVPDLVETGNTVIDGDYPTLTDFTNPTVERPSDAEVAAWLAA